MYPDDLADLSTSSSSDADEAESEVFEAELAELFKQLDTNPYLYDIHVRRITLLLKAGELYKLREARELMSKCFPLTPDMWLQWIKDETSVLTKDDNREPVYELFKRALSDYQCVDVWLQYCQFVQSQINWDDPVELEHIRSVMEEAIACQGLNFAQGATLFQVYRKFETSCLAQLQTKADSVAVAKQIEKIDILFRRQLSVPGVDLDQTMEDYKMFLDSMPDLTGGSVSVECKAAFESAKSKWQAVKEYEAAVAESSDEDALLSAWQSYLSWAVEYASRKATRANVTKKMVSTDQEFVLTPMEVICLFERALTSLCLQVSLWLQLADYLEVHVAADRQRLTTTLSRAVRNVPWNSGLWCRYALACEAQAWDLVATSDPPCNGDGSTVSRLSREFDPVIDIYEEALKYGYPSAIDLTALWLAYSDFLLRVFVKSQDFHLKEQTKQMLRSSFERAQKHVSAAFPDRADEGYSIHRYWAFVEVRFFSDKDRCRGLWKSLLKIDHNGNKPAFWIAYLDFVKNHDDVDYLVRVAGMAVNSVTGEYTETVFQTARRCLAEIAVDLRLLREFDIKVTQRRARLAVLETSKKMEQQQRGIRSDKSSGKAPKPGKRKLDDGQNPPSIATDAKRCKVGVEKALRKSDDNNDNDDVAEKADMAHPRHGESVVHDPSKDEQTVFVSNLPFSTTEEELKIIFKECGEVTSVRLVRDYAGKSKGFGFVQFAEESSASAALELDRHPIATGTSAIGRPMFVSVCDTNRAKSSGFTYSTGAPEPNKLFVRNLDSIIDKEALQTFFGKHGRVTSVRVATFRNGVPKGHAYVEFASEEEASRALVATDGVVFGSKSISVAISNPPPRSTEPTFHAEHDQGKARTSSMHVPIRPNARKNLPFIPRALHRPGVGASTTQPSSQTATSEILGAPKSNADFRKMFLKQ